MGSPALRPISTNTLVQPSNLTNWGTGALAYGAGQGQSDSSVMAGLIPQPSVGVQPPSGLLDLAKMNLGSVNPNAAGAPGAGGGIFGGLFDNFLNKTNGQGITEQGWGAPALGIAQGLGNAFMGMKQYGLAKDQLAEGKRQFEMNYGAQRDLTNASLMDRQRARVASNAGAYQGVDEYMAQYGVR